MATHTIRVVVENRVHKCDPTETHVNGGDRVVWGGSAEISFPKGAPFVENGPFKPGSVSSVRKGVFQRGDRFVGTTERQPVQGTIIIDDP